MKVLNVRGRGRDAGHPRGETYRRCDETRSDDDGGVEFKLARVGSVERQQGDATRQSHVRV